MTTRSPRVGPSTPEREERQADELDRHYTTLVLHPSLAAATYRGLTDGTPKPAYDAPRSRAVDRPRSPLPPAHPGGGSPLPSAGDPLTWLKATAAIGLVEGIAVG
jgi:hypothetical protein